MTVGAQLKRTLLVRCATMLADESVLRHIGLNSESTLDDVQRILEICFTVPEGPPSPTRFTRDAADPGRLDTGTEIGVYLQAPGDELFFHWGLWQFELTLLDIYPRDDATPHALCVAGAGDFAETPFDIPAINAELLGPSAIENVMEGVRDEVADVVDRSRTMDFLPLLQALDLPRAVELAPGTADTLATLPREQTDIGRDAFWCTLLALSCLADDDATTDDVIETTMAALGWTSAGGGVLPAAAVRQLCAGSLVRLASVGGYAAGGVSSVDKLDMYRALLRRG